VQRSSIADYTVLAEPTPGRLTCRPPTRLVGEGEVLVTPVAAGADSWQAVCDQLARMATAGSEYLLRLLEVGADLESGRMFYASEPIPRGTLASPTPPLDRGGRLRAVAAAARAAHALHQVGIVHGSIEPGAVLLSGRGAVLSPPPLDSRPGAIPPAGSPGRLPTVDPDLLRGDPPSRASDIWSLGATAHWAASERPLFPDLGRDGPVVAVQQVLFTRPVVDSELPDPLRELIEACLDPDPGSRPPTAAEVADRLEAAA
jgi:serine/threonine protein kinase